MKKNKITINKDLVMQLMTNIFDGSEDLIAAIAPDYCLTAFNQAYQTEFKRIWGKEVKLGENVQEILSDLPAKQENSKELWTRALHGEKFKKVHVIGDGTKTQQYYEISYSPIEDLTGKIIGAVQIARNITPVVNAEIILKKDKERYHNLVENAPLAIFQTRLNDSKILYINNEYVKLLELGSKEEALQYKAVNFFKYPEERPKIIEQTKKSGGTINNYELELVTYKGNNRTVIFSAVISGEIINGTFIDITAQKQLEAALKLKEREISELVEVANSIILRWSPQGLIRFINHYGLTFFGYQPEELIGKPVMLLVPDIESAGRELTHLPEQIISHPEHYQNFQNENIKKNGERVWIVWTNKAIVDQTGHIQEILAIGNDITELKKTQHAIEDEKEKNREILDSISDSFFALDANWQFTYVNQQAAYNLGIKAETLMGKNFWTEFPILIEKGYDKYYRKAMEEGIAVEFEMGHPYDPEDWFNIKIYPAKEGISVYWTNITAKKKAQEKRIMDIVRLASNMAHEIRTPLASIGAANYNIYRKCLTADTQHSYNNINKKIKEIDNVINELLVYTQVKTVNYEAVNIDETLQEALAASFAIHQSWSVNVKENIQFDKTLSMSADKEQLILLFRNLINNAFEALADKSGQIVISGDYLEHNKLKISIEDNGSGMEQETLKKAAEPFFTTKLHGIGLGITISKQIISNHYGELILKSVKGKGTIATVILPLPRATE